MIWLFEALFTYLENSHGPARPLPWPTLGQPHQVPGAPGLGDTAINGNEWGNVLGEGTARVEAWLFSEN